MSYSYLNNIRLKKQYFSQWDQSPALYQCNLILDNLIVQAVEKYHDIDKSVSICDVSIEIGNSKVQNQYDVGVNVKYVKNLRKFEIAQYIYDLETHIRRSIKKFILSKITIKLRPINNPLANAKYVCYMVSREMARRINYKKLQKIGKLVLESGAKGCILVIQGRINGHEIARKDMFIIGKIGRNTFSNNVQYRKYTHNGRSGTVGIKVWINNGPLKQYQHHNIKT